MIEISRLYHSLLRVGRSQIQLQMLTSHHFQLSKRSGGIEIELNFAFKARYTLAEKMKHELVTKCIISFGPER